MSSFHSRLTLFLSPLTLFLCSCGTIPPLRGKIEVGRDAYAVFVGGSGANGDLYAVRADGGPTFPITYTTVAELRPELAPDGTSLAFFRGKSLRDSTPATVWVMNLLNGAEQQLRLPKDAGTPQRLGWSRDGQSLVVETTSGLYQLKAPPGRADPQLVAADERAMAESSLAVLLGDPVFARVLPCERRTDLCVLTAKGKRGILAQAARDPVRWGPDSVAVLVGGDLVQIRPLAKGRPRVLEWTGVPQRPREMTFFEGQAE